MNWKEERVLLYGKDLVFTKLIRSALDNTKNNKMKKIEKRYNTHYHYEFIEAEFEVNKEGLRDGYYKIFHSNGQLKAELSYTNDIQNDGEIISYHHDGSKARQVNCVLDNLNGEFFEWYENGQLKRHGYYENNQCYVTLMNFNNTTINEATKEWLNDEKKAETKYGGHISNWDVSNVTEMNYMFKGASSFNQDLSKWDVSNVTEMKYMFEGASSFNQDTSSWDVSQVKSMSGMFNGASSFNQNLGKWDVSKVTDMWVMFKAAKSFNQDISAWDVSQVKSMSGMFEGAKSFNQDISSWDVSQVTNMQYMFKGAKSFNQDLNNWDVSQVTIMEYMFNGASSFNQDISAWDVSRVTRMREIFKGAKSFNQDISAWYLSMKFNNTTINEAAKEWLKDEKSAETKYGGHISNWDVSQVTNMEHMFNGASSFNQDLSNWDVSQVTNMEHMFNGASSFNQDLSNWDVNQVTNIKYMFNGASSFNQPIGDWDVSNVTYMNNMFNGASSFNQDLSKWDVSQVTKMYQMFLDAHSFNQPIGDWDVSNVTTMTRMLKADAFNQDLSKWREINWHVKFQRQMFSKEFSKNFDINSLTKKIDIIITNKISKKAIPKIKKLFKTRDYNNIDSAIEILRSLDDKSLYEYFLAGVKINPDGRLITTTIFTGSRLAQPYLDYALILLMNFAPKNLIIHESIKRNNINVLKLSAKLEESIATHAGMNYLPNCGVYTTHQLPDLLFENLEEITLYNYQNLDSLKFLLNCKKLKKINIYSCDNIKDANLFPKKIYLINE